MPDFLKALDELEKQDALRAKTSIKQETLEGRIITSVDNTGSSNFPNLTASLQECLSVLENSSRRNRYKDSRN